jgi:hypothetical protein
MLRQAGSGEYDEWLDDRTDDDLQQVTNGHV